MVDSVRGQWCVNWWLVCCCDCYFVSTAVAVDSSHMTATSWSRFSPPLNFVNGHVLTMWFMVCRWPQSQESDWARPHLCKSARHGPWPVRKRFIIDHVWRGRWKPGCRIVGSVTIVWLTTEADDQSSLHCVSHLNTRKKLHSTLTLDWWQVSTKWALTCPETVHQRPRMTREIETWLSDSRFGDSNCDCDC